MRETYNFIDLVNAIYLGTIENVKKIITFIVEYNADILLKRDDNGQNIFHHISENGDEELQSFVSEIFTELGFGQLIIYDVNFLGEDSE